VGLGETTDARFENGGRGDGTSFDDGNDDYENVS